MVVNLQDETIVSEKTKIFTNRQEDVSEDANNKANNLNFIKKHIKYKVSELFFSDAIIFVEGVTEETLIKYWIEQDKDLHLYYISIFNINGAYGHIYDELIKQLKVPTLIITDLDIKMKNNKNDKHLSDEDKFPQVYYSDIKDEKTTNETLKYYHGESLSKLIEHDRYQKDNLYVAYQNEITDFIPTSLEEAIILTNYKNEILKNALKETKPRLYQRYREKDDENIKLKSRLFQEKLNQDKAEFSNRLFLAMITKGEGSSDFEKPKYINNGLDWLKGRLV